MLRPRAHIALALAFAVTTQSCTLSLWRHDGFHPPPQNHPTAIEAAALDSNEQLWLQLTYPSPWPARATAKLDWAPWTLARATRATMPTSTTNVHVCEPGELDRMLRENKDPAHHALPPAVWLSLEIDPDDHPIVWVLDSRGPLRGQRITLPRAGPDWLASATALHILVTPVTAAADLAVLPIYLLLVVPYLAGLGH